MAENGLSIDVGAELAKLSTTPAPTPEASPAPETPASDVSDSFDSDQPGSFWTKQDVPDEIEAADEAEEVESSEAEESEESPIGSFKFKGDGKELELDPIKDRAEIEKRLSLSEGAKRAFTAKARLEKENRSLSTKVKDWEPKVQLLEKMQKAYEDSGGSVEVAYEIFSGGKSLEKEIERRVEEQLAYLNASPEEQRQMEREREEKMREQAEERARRALAREREELEQEKFQTKVDKAHSMAFPAFKGVVNEMGIKDPVERRGVSRMLWRQTWDNIRDLGDDVEFTPELFEREFNAAAKLLGHSRKEAAQQEVAKIVEQKKEVAKKKAATAVSRGYKRGAIDPKKLDGLSPTKIYETLFGT